MVTSSIDVVLRSSSFVNKMLFHGKTNAVSVTVDMEERDYLDVIRVCLGWLKCIGTDSSMLFSMPCLCSPYPGSEVPKSVHDQAKTAVRRTSERSERRGGTSGHPGP